MKTKLQTFAVSIWSCRSQRAAACEHVEASSLEAAHGKAQALAAGHGEDYRVQWVKPFEGRKVA